MKSELILVFRPHFIWFQNFYLKITFNVLINFDPFEAPETANKEYNEKVDIWSAGCVIYELCTFKKAIAGNDRNTAAENIKRGRINDARITPDSLDTLVRNK